MTRFVSRLGFVFGAATVLCGGFAAHADEAARPVTARTFANDLSREFSVVPAGDALYTHLAAVREAGWSTLGASSSTMTRYEMALETAKAFIAVRARQRADARWAVSAPTRALGSLRVLCNSLQAELSRFDISSKNAVAELDKWIELSTRASTPAANPSAPTPSFPASMSLPASIETTRRFSRGLTPDEETEVMIPLSQRLRVYGAVSSLARSTSDPLQNEQSTPGGALRLGPSTRTAFGSAGASLALTNWLQIRGEASQRASARTLGDALMNNRAATSGEERSIGGGVDLTLSPGVVLSGNVAQFKTEGGLLSGFSSFNGTRYVGGLELSGWQNRVALSANLSRLVPEDSMALSLTAAQLNLGVGLTEQISLKLLYQQLFETPQQARSNRVVAGGININF